MNRTLLAVAMVAIVALAGCSALSDTGQSDVDSGVELADNSTGATNVSQSVGVTVDETAAGEELTEIGVVYPRDRFVVDSAQHDGVDLGVDTDDDGTLEESFDETNVSGVNNNAYSFDVTLDTDYTLESGDVVTVEYPAVDNPSESGEYTVETRLNDRQTANATVVIE